MGSKEKKKQKTMENNSSQKSKGKGSGKGKPQMITDDRFASAHSDPRFMEVIKKRSKVSIDSRFQRVFTDKRFSSSARIDKRGKRNKNKKAASSLEHYYSLEREKEKEEEEEDLGDRKAKKDESDSETDIEDEKLTETVDGDESDDVDEQDSDESSSTTSTDSEDEFSDGVEEEDTFMLPEDDVPDIDKETKRLAIVNLDWSQVRAVDLYVLLCSFLPKDGQIQSVSVYPSDFGVQRMEEEAVRGPVGLFDDEESDDEEDGELDSKKLRTYELSRLRYYYAVVECDSIATADHLYKTCDGLEFERSANKLDLRFIPDSMDFKHQPRDVATEAPPNYEGLDIQTRALQHSNIQLTWDEDEPQRAKTLNRKLTDDQLAELELNEILASDESESDNDNDNDKKVDVYRSLIQGGDVSDEEDNENDNDQEMEVTFNSGLEDISKRILEKKSKKSETVWEAYLRKRKEKKKASKNMSKDSSEDDSDTDQESGEDADDFFIAPSAVGGKTKPDKKGKRNAITGEAEATTAELELLAADGDDGETNLKGYNLKPKKQKGKKGAIRDVGKVATADDDPRFSALFTSPLYSLDPTDPQFKRSATYARQLAGKNKMADEENTKRKNSHGTHDQAPAPKDENTKISDEQSTERKEKNELVSLVKSIKMKSKQVSLPSQSKSHKRKR